MAVPSQWFINIHPSSLNEWTHSIWPVSVFMYCFNTQSINAPHNHFFSFSWVYHYAGMVYAVLLCPSIHLAVWHKSELHQNDQTSLTRSCKQCRTIAQWVWFPDANYMEEVKIQWGTKCRLDRLKSVTFSSNTLYLGTIQDRSIVSIKVA